MVRLRLKPRRGWVRLAVPGGPAIEAWASGLCYSGPTAEQGSAEEPVLDRGRPAGYRTINGLSPMFRLGCFLAGVGRSELAAVMKEAFDLELELSGVGRLRLGGVRAETDRMEALPGGVWLECVGRVTGRIERTKGDGSRK